MYCKRREAGRGPGNEAKVTLLLPTVAGDHVKFHCRGTVQIVTWSIAGIQNKLFPWQMEVPVSQQQAEDY